MAKMMPRDKYEGEGPNKYNATKGWENENTNSEPFVSADDSLAYVKPKKYAMIDNNPSTEEEAVKQEAVQEEEDNGLYQEPEPYKRVDWKKRYDDLKRHYDKKVNSFKEKEEELKQKILETRPKYTPPKSEEELQKFRNDNPDLYAVVESVSHLQANRELEQMKTQLDAVKEKLQYEEARAAYAELKTLVPDFEEIRASEDFHKWAEEQPEQIQAWIYQNRTDAQLAAKAINLYKADRGGAKRPAQSQPVQRGGAEEAVTTSRRTEEPTPRDKVWTTSEIDRLVKKNWREYERLQPEIDRAFAEGRVVQG